MSKNKFMSKVRVFLVPPSTSFNPIWKAYKLLSLGLFFLAIGFWSSYESYRHQIYKRVEVQNISDTRKNKNLILNGLTVELSQTKHILLKPESYGQQLVFDLDPKSSNLFSVSFASIFFIVCFSMFFVLKSTPKDFKFSKVVLSGLSKLPFIIYAIIAFKVFIVWQYYGYMRTLLGSEFNLIESEKTLAIGSLYFFGLLITVLLTFINYYKKGLELQAEQDLTV